MDVEDESIYSIPKFLEKNKLKQKEGAMEKRLAKTPGGNKNKDNMELQVHKGKDIERAVKKPITQKPFVKKNPERNVPKVDYKEPEIPADDRYIYCDTCEKEFLDCCPKCGKLSALRDNSVPWGVLNRAKLTLPKNMLEIRPSNIHGLGVYASRSLKKGVRLGPYQGEVVKDLKEEGGVYGWLLRNGKIVDGADETKSNWLRYINCSRNIKEQNLVAFQYKGHLYYRTCRDVKPEEELLVFYGTQYAMGLGIDLKQYYKGEANKYNEACTQAIKKIQKVECSQKGNKYVKNELQTEKVRNHQDRKYFGFKVKLVEEFIEVTQVSDQNEQYYEPEVEEELEKAYFCPYCPIGFTIEEYKERHVKRCQHNPIKKVYETLQYFTCQYCKYTLTSQDFLIHHEKWCRRKSYIISGLSRYRRRVISINSNAEENILREATNSGDMEFNDRIFMCYHCNYHSKWRSSLIRHIQSMHFGNRAPTFKCYQCNHTTKQKNDLLQHIRAKHASSATKYRCDQCEFTTAYKFSLNRHKRIHDEISKYICPLCRTGFNHKQLLTNHMNKHMDKPGKHKCHVCTYTSHNNSDLKQHINAKHTRATIYKCEYCSYRSTDQRNVKRHTVYKHTNIKPYKCTYCTYTCAFNGDLKQHINNKHTKATIYKCEYCTYTSTEQSAVKRHTVYKHTNIKPYKCTYCTYTCVENGDLKRHIRRKHKATSVINV